MPRTSTVAPSGQAGITRPELKSGTTEKGSSESRVPGSRRRIPAEEQTTAREAAPPQVDSIQYLGRLADKMFAMGRVDAAVKILDGRLGDLLSAARAGQLPDAHELDAAGRYAMRLANETLNARWVDTAVELHLLACRPMREDTAQQLASLRSKAPLGSTALLHRYHEKLRSNMSDMSAAERLLCDGVSRLV